MNYVKDQIVMPWLIAMQFEDPRFDLIFRESVREHARMIRSAERSRDAKIDRQIKARGDRLTYLWLTQPKKVKEVK